MNLTLFSGLKVVFIKCAPRRWPVEWNNGSQGWTQSECVQAVGVLGAQRAKCHSFFFNEVIKA